MSKELSPTTADVAGPFYVPNAPFRCALAPPGSDGDALLVHGRVLDTAGEPIPFAVVDLWQTSAHAEYDYYEPGEHVPYTGGSAVTTHGRAREFAFRARTVTDERGCYEFVSVVPVPYFDPADGTWRCPHVHYRVLKEGFKELVTQLYFEGLEKNDTDAHIDATRTIPLAKKTREPGAVSKEALEYYEGTFDIVLARAE